MEQFGTDQPLQTHVENDTRDTGEVRTFDIASPGSSSLQASRHDANISDDNIHPTNPPEGITTPDHQSSKLGAAASDPQVQPAEPTNGTVHAPSLIPSVADASLQNQPVQLARQHTLATPMVTLVAPLARPTLTRLKSDRSKELWGRFLKSFMGRFRVLWPLKFYIK